MSDTVTDNADTAKSGQNGNNRALNTGVLAGLRISGLDTVYGKIDNSGQS